MRKQQRRVLIDLEKMREAVWLARMCQTNTEISRLTGLSDGRITYRLRLYKDVARMEQTLRQRWRSGSDPLLIKFFEDYGAVMNADFNKQFLSQVIHVPMETAGRKPNRKKSK